MYVSRLIINSSAHWTAAVLLRASSIRRFSVPTYRRLFAAACLANVVGVVYVGHPGCGEDADDGGRNVRG